MDSELHDNVHIVPFGVERDRIVDPAIKYGATVVVLLDYLTHPAPARPDREEITCVLEDHGIAYECRDASVADLFDALAVVGQAVIDHADENVFVNLATGNKPIAVGAMIACMTLDARPYYVQADVHGSHRGPVPKGVQSINSIPPYPMDRPERQLLQVMAHIRDSDRMTVEEEPYRIKRELIEFGEREGLPFVADYEGETNKGKFRRLNAHVISPLKADGFIRVKEVGTQRRVFLTDDGWNTLRGFEYCIEQSSTNNN